MHYVQCATLDNLAVSLYMFQMTHLKSWLVMRSGDRYSLRVKAVQYACERARGTPRSPAIKYDCSLIVHLKKKKKVNMRLSVLILWQAATYKWLCGNHWSNIRDLICNFKWGSFSSVLFTTNKLEMIEDRPHIEQNTIITVNISI